MPMSETGKQGNVLVRQSNDKFEHLPIKKRRFLYRSPSPPPQTPPVNDESSNFSKSKVNPLQSLVTSSVSCKSELGTLAVDKAAVQGNIKSVEDFSGISMLAAAACSTSSGREFGYAEDGSGVEEPSVDEGPVEVSTNSEAHSFSKGLVKEEPVNTPDVSTGGALSCVTTALAGKPASVSTDCTSVKVESLEKCSKDPFHEDIKPTVSSDVSSMRDEDVDGFQKQQSRDDRSHWDLNVVMDAWEQPSDYQNSHFSDYVSQDSGIFVGCPPNRDSADHHDLLNEPEGSMCDDRKKLLHCDTSKSPDKASQDDTTPQAGDINNKSQRADMCNTSVSSEYKSITSSLADGNISVQPLVSRYMSKAPPSLNPFDTEKFADSKPIRDSINFSPLFRDQKNISVPDRNCTLVSVGGSVTRNRSASEIGTQGKFAVRPTLDIQDELTLKSTMSDNPFDCGRQSMKDDDNGSQYEDGELVLEEYDVDNEKPKHNDSVYNKSSYIVTATDHHYTESGHMREVSHRNACNAGTISSAGEIANELYPRSDRPIADDNSLKLVHSRDEKMEGLASSEMFESNKMSSATVFPVRDDCDGTGRIYNLATESPDPEGIDSRTGYMRRFPSQSNGPVGRDMFFRDDQAGSRSKLGSSYIKYSERASYSRQGQSRVHKVNNWNDSSNDHRGYKRNYSPTYHTLVNTLDEEDTEGKEDRDGTLSAASHLSHDESVTDVGMAGNCQPNYKRNGGQGSDRLTNRGRFQRYDRQMDHGAGRGRFHRRPLSQRDKTFSPNERRGCQFVHQSRSRSPSRSRTRSPDPRGSPYLRHTSRSPNFRSEARTTRMRSPNQQRFRPFQRDHGSPPSSRWISNRKDEPGHFTYKHKSPNTGRFSDSARNSKPDVHYRQCTGRFSDMDGNGSRPHRLEENFENRRRQFGIASRLCRDNDDGFVSRNRNADEFHGRGNTREIDNRNEDMPRRFRRDGNFMYERDGAFRSNSKQFGFSRTDSSRDLESGAPYRSNYPGRYNDMNERRRQYSNDADGHLPILPSSCDDNANDSRVGNLRIRQSEDQQFGLCDQEKKLGEASESLEVEVPAEK